MSHFVRQSKYRHIFCDQPKAQECFSGFRFSTTVGEQPYIKANEKYFSVAIQGGGGPFTVVPLDQPGAIPLNQPYFNGHTGAVLDFEFNPFHSQIISTSSDDTTVKVWGIPEEGLKENINEPLMTLQGHHKKVVLLKHHPTASNALLSASSDLSVKLWDIESGGELHSFEECGDLIQDIAWDTNGNQFAVSSKDKCIRFVDARSNCVAAKKDMAHDGAKSVKITYLGNEGKFLSVGFDRQSKRQIKLWDPRNPSQMITKLDVDQSAGVLMPFYDEDTSILYLVGKGDGNIRWYELVNEAPHIFHLGEYRSSTSTKGACIVPKRGLNIMKNETARIMKMTSQNTVEPLSVTVPRKGDFFQEDLFPDTRSGQPSHTVSEWLEGSDKAPLKMSLNPNSAVAGGGSSSSTSISSFKTPTQLKGELKEATDRIKYLEDLLQKNSINF